MLKSNMLADGGVMQEGGTVDPVSGNDVPPGAMQEEVRDDIPAQLSEGEFVFSADVVRYWGLEKLMALRDKAKAGLKKMEDIGQMGNADQVEDPEALHGGEEMDDDTFSAEVDDIIGETDAEAMGGTREFAVGGLAKPGTDYLAKYNIPRTAITNPALDVRAYKNADGRIMYITFFNGKPSTPIPAGFEYEGTGQEVAATKKEEEKPKDVVTATETTQSDQGGSSYDASPTGQPTSSTTTPTSYADLSLPSSVTGGKGKAVNVAGALVGGMLFGPIGATLGAKASNIMNFLSTQSAEGAWGDFVGSNLNSIGYSPEAVTAAKDAMNAAMGVQGATKSDVAAAGANAASKVDMVDPLQALLDATDNFGTTLGGDTLSAAVEAAPAAEAEAGFDAPSWDAGQPDYSGGDSVSDQNSEGTTNGDNSPAGGFGEGEYAKGGLVKKRINKKTRKQTSFVTRQK